eukprot:Platyproteum_vivax@DN3252_c0_g1_i1.p1
MQTSTQKIAVAGGVTLGVSVALYLLAKEWQKTKKASSSEVAAKKLDVSEIDRDTLLQLLREIRQSQETLREVIKGLCQELYGTKPRLMDVYNKVKTRAPLDPLDKYGLTMLQFDSLLEKFGSDIHVKAHIDALEAPSFGSGPSPKARNTTKKTVIEVHQLMLDELQAVAKEFLKMRPGALDPKLVTMAAQAIVASKVEHQFAMTSEDIEGAVLMLRPELVQDSNFGELNLSLQQTLAQIMGHNIISS